MLISYDISNKDAKYLKLPNAAKGKKEFPAMDLDISEDSLITDVIYFSPSLNSGSIFKITTYGF